jgi:hypothetical protein
MGQAIGDVLPAAVGVGLNPFAIIAAILLGLSPKTRANGPAFLVGWLLGIIVVVGLAVLVTSPDDISGEDGDPASTSYAIEVVVGLVLLFLAYRKWTKRPTDDETPSMPKWMGAIENATPISALGAGAMFSSVYPKSLLFNIAAGTMIAQADLSVGEAIFPVAVYVVVASLGVGAPVIWRMVSPRRAATTLDVWKTWLTANNVVITAVLLLVFGVTFFGKGLGGLID